MALFRSNNKDMVWIPGKGRMIQFRDGVYETDDQMEIETLRKFYTEDKVDDGEVIEPTVIDASPVYDNAAIPEVAPKRRGRPRNE